MNFDEKKQTIPTSQRMPIPMATIAFAGLGLLPISALLSNKIIDSLMAVIQEFHLLIFIYFGISFIPSIIAIVFVYYRKN
ncbi:MAG: hypothetical protein FWG42_06855 [Clostridiales bacterium]|nr:hypothetical protein [Clostridiales bacterium]